MPTTIYWLKENLTLHKEMYFIPWEELQSHMSKGIYRTGTNMVNKIMKIIKEMINTKFKMVIISAGGGVRKEGEET